jgi:uncharacterized membrane protein
LTSRIEAERQPQRWETGRVEAFSDGVLAIAITLLVLEIKLPGDAYEHLGRSLGHEWPSYLAYVTSFLTIGGIWMAHHGLFSRLNSVDLTLTQINLLLLMVVSFLPFPTGLLAGALHSSDRSERIAIGVYGGTLLLSQVAYGALIRYALKHPELHDRELMLDSPPPARQRDANQGGLFYALAIAAGVTFVPKFAAVAYLVIGARALFVSGGRRSLLRR